MSVAKLLLADAFLWSVMAPKVSTPSQILQDKVCNDQYITY